MIFVTTGSTKQSNYYLLLLIKLEQLKKDGLIKDDIIVQAGYTGFKSSFFKEIFDFTTNFEEYINDADTVITADGAGTVFNLLTKQKKIIVVPNKLASRYGAPADDLIGGFEADKYLLWCRDINTILESINEAKSREFSIYVSPKNNISEKIMFEYRKWTSEN